jgi:hypothetical protein
MGIDRRCPWQRRKQGRPPQTFWADRERGMSAYLWAAAGNEAMIEIVDPGTSETLTRPARVVTEEKPPRDKADALSRWQRALPIPACIRRG